ncbi:MAG TPA: biotin--[acetyl-CoA-carboxylase] ligase [Sedimentisphaerales bacterium]|nr:biotin--[acetyl-CoA-carboxylase] ligase [Sedimentisphaerales bacterium]HRS10948.1 biotin--[acetyl-CoA-carboxylase] ligase [Sedimentisphaerales bacterium]HRV48642.1 biotin--[acetyl-CoA-carboxylase] ligase [Sedimentisphaerales bacterium]
MPRDDRLDPDRIRFKLKTRRIGRQVLVYERTGSTNDVAAACATHQDNDGLVVFAEEQTAGRGRTGASWQSPYGESLLFSVLLIGCPPAGELLSLTCAVAVAEALGTVGGHRARIKWPNDVLLADKKVCGILVESKRVSRISNLVSRPPGSSRGSSRDTNQACPERSRGEIRDTTVIGVGINCHQSTDSFPPELRDVATSLDLVAGGRCDRITLARRTLASLDQWLRTAEENKEQVIKTWSDLSTQLGQRVTLSYDGRAFTGHCIGIDPANGLILQLDRGGVRMFDAAHTTLLK